MHPAEGDAASTASAASLYGRLLAISREAHGSGQHETAYHALTAAMHAAHDAGDARALAEVEREAEAQIAWIDANVPGHRLSTTSAGQHQHPGVFAMLARQAGTHAQLLTAPASRARAPHEAPGLADPEAGA